MLEIVGVVYVFFGILSGLLWLLDAELAGLALFHLMVANGVGLVRVLGWFELFSVLSLLLAVSGFFFTQADRFRFSVPEADE